MFRKHCTNKLKSMKNISNDKLYKQISNIFYDVQKSISTKNIEQQNLLFTSSFFKTYQKKKKLFVSSEKIFIEDIKLQDITNFKLYSKGVTVDIIFSVLTHTKHDKNTVRWRTRKNYSVYFPNKEFGEESVYKQCIKQRWFFVYESNSLKVSKIKGIYLKQLIE